MLVAVSREGSPLGYRVVDMRAEYPSLLKELACRAVANNAALSGNVWTLRLRLEDVDSAAPAVLLEAHLDDDNDHSRPTEAMAAMKVPISNFHWVAAGIAAQLQVKGRYSYSVAIPEPESSIVTHWKTAREGEDFEFLLGTVAKLVLPTGFSVDEPSGPRRVMDKADTWLRCVFAARAFAEFIGAAAQETERERSWLGLGDVYLTQDACYVTIKEGLVELPGEASLSWVKTHGRDWVRLHNQIGNQLVAFLHLHPRMACDRELKPFPSASDSVVAWNVDLSSPRPTVFPIAICGADVSSPSGHVAAHGYERGLLTRIQLEIGP